MKITKATSKNNYQILHIQKESPISLILFLVKNGSRFETKETSGISHFLEHMLFKPTAKRTSTKEINTEIESIGGAVNAFTGNEFTGYYIQVLKENFNHAFEILSDITQNGVFNESDIELEKGVVVEEIRMYEDSPMDQVSEFANQNIFFDQQLGRSILGTETTVNSFNRESLLKFAENHYLQENFLVVTVGNFDEKQTLENVEKFIKPRKSGELSFEKAKFSPKQKINYHHKEEINQTHAIISFEGVSRFSPDIYKYTLVDAVLGTGMGSILFELLREKLGVVYYVNTSHNDFLDNGVFEISFGCNIDKTKLSVDKIFEELKGLKTSLILNTELVRAKNLLFSYYAMKHESIGFLGQKYGIDYLLEGKFEEIETVREKVFAITEQDILETANKIFTENFNITYIANKELL